MSSITPAQMALVEHCKTHGVLCRFPGSLWQAGTEYKINYLKPLFRGRLVAGCIESGLLLVVGIDKQKRPTQVTVVP